MELYRQEEAVAAMARNLSIDKSTNLNQELLYPWSQHKP
jgi:hypothetical protein